MVLLARVNVTRDVLVLLPVLLCSPVITIAALLVADSLNALPVLFVVVGVLVFATCVGVGFLLAKRGTSWVPFGPETPSGPR